MFSLIIVEDSTLLRHGLVHSISQNLPWIDIIGEAEDAIQGKAMILERRPEIVLTDIRLPGMTGLQMLQEVMQVYKPQMVVVSGYSEFEYCREALSLGVLAYIVKPIDEKELEDSLKYAASKLLDSRHIDKGLLYTGKQKGAASGGKGAAKAHYVNQVIRFIHSSYAEDISVSGIAKRLNISEDYLGRIFKEGTSFSISEYRNNYRVARASQMLSRADMAINEIARSVGIENQHYFSQLFKQKMGVTPTQYRDFMLTENLLNTDGGVAPLDSLVNPKV